MAFKPIIGVTRTCLVVVSIFISSVQAELIDNNDGTITQIMNDGTNLMWVKNANLAGNKMSWDDAVKWANDLVYAGYDDWRLPATLPVNSVSYDTLVTFDGTTDFSVNIISRNSEMGYMYKVELENLAFWPPTATSIGNPPQPGYGLSNTGPFINLQPGMYWSFHILGSDRPWCFDWGEDFAGMQGACFKSSGMGYAWAVRGGNVPQCNDSKDNDDDGLIDFPQDSGCINLGGDDESQCFVLGGARVCTIQTMMIIGGALVVVLLMFIIFYRRKNIF